MTFGQELKRLLSISGITSAYLAQKLGYDTSYISRWINDAKLPSLKNNNELLASIASCIIGTNKESVPALIREYCPGRSEAHLYSAVLEALRTAYEQTNTINDTRSILSTNALFSKAETDITDAFIDALSKLFEGRTVVNAICTTPLGIQSNKDHYFWEKILSNAKIPPDSQLVFNQIIDLRDFAENVDAYCAAICTYAHFNSGVRYEFYKYYSTESSSNISLILLEDRLYHQSMTDPYSQIVLSIDCADNAAISAYSTLLFSKLYKTEKLISYCIGKELNADHFLYDYVMDGGLRYLLDTMHPIFCTNSFLKKIMSKYGIKDQGPEFCISYNEQCSQAVDDIIIYRSVLLEYIYSGKISILGKMLELDISDRIEHLTKLIDFISLRQIRIALIDDDNPLLSRQDTQVSVFMSRIRAFMVAPRSEDTNILRFHSRKAVSCFHKFFDHFFELGPAYSIEGQDVISFIKRGIESLQNQRDPKNDSSAQ